MTEEPESEAEPRSGRVWSGLINTLIGVFTLGLGVLIALVLLVRGNSAQAVAPDPLSVAVSLTDAAAGDELTVQPPLELRHRRVPKGIPVIRVDTDTTEQKITGFGVTMDAESARLLETSMIPDARGDLLASLFGTGGLHLNVMRVPMGATRSSLAAQPYTYDDGTVDPDLARFSVDRDEAYILPALRQAYSHNYSMRFLATPWSLPAWMKKNEEINNLNGTGKLSNAFITAYGEYFVKFIQAYLKARVPISAITPANSPGFATARPGMNISAREEMKLIEDGLIPALRQAGLQTRIYAGDVSWSSTRFLSRLATSTAATEILGLAYHCYGGTPTEMDTVHQLSSGLGAIVSECTPATTSTPVPEVIISSLRNWASQVDLGRLATGAMPDESIAQADAPAGGLVTIDSASGDVVDNPSYYELGQASEFIRPGAYRVRSNTFVRYARRAAGGGYATSGLDDVAVLNPDGSVALMVYNNSSTSRRFAVKWHGYAITDQLAAHATISFRWRQGGLARLAKEATETQTAPSTTQPALTTTAASGG